MPAYNKAESHKKYYMQFFISIYFVFPFLESKMQDNNKIIRKSQLIWEYKNKHNSDSHRMDDKTYNPDDH